VAYFILVRSNLGRRVLVVQVFWHLMEQAASVTGVEFVDHAGTASSASSGT